MLSSQRTRIVTRVVPGTDSQRAKKPHDGESAEDAADDCAGQGTAADAVAVYAGVVFDYLAWLEVWVWDLEAD
jgi:hypothetical protein